VWKIIDRNNTRVEQIELKRTHVENGIDKNSTCELDRLEEDTCGKRYRKNSTRVEQDRLEEDTYGR
jgi:hypothetical protein